MLSSFYTKAKTNVKEKEEKLRLHCEQFPKAGVELEGLTCPFIPNADFSAACTHYRLTCQNVCGAVQFNLAK